MCALIGLKNLMWQNAIGGFTTDFIEILYHYQGIKVFFFFLEYHQGIKVQSMY